MADRSPDPDDWWATPAPVATRAPSAPAPVEDDWVEEPEPRAPARERRPIETGRGIRIAAAALGALVLLVVGLYLAGVFDSGTKPQAPPSTPAQTTTAQTTTTTPVQPKTPRVPAPTVAVSFGASGAQVKVLQRALVSLGDRPGPVDGDYGPLTKAAVERFQTSAKLVADGIVGPKTLAELKQALSAG
jgi:hypothetical protein